MYTYFLLKIFYTLETRRLFNFDLAFDEYTSVRKLSIKYKSSHYYVNSIYLNNYWIEEIGDEYLDFHFMVDNKDVEIIYSKVEDKFTVKSEDSNIIELFNLNSYKKVDSSYLGVINKGLITFYIDGEPMVI